MILFFLIIFPFIELWLLIEIGAEIGGFITLLWIILSGTIGVAMVRAAGLVALQPFAQQNLSLLDPAQHSLSGALILIGGIMLIVPGFITDIVGGLCLLNPVRNRLAQFILHSSNTFSFISRCSKRQPFVHNSPKQKDDQNGPKIIDSDWRSEDN